MKLCEVFQTVQGEGLYSGAITTFIRFAGCSLKCRDCDTKFSWDSNATKDISVPLIIEEVLKVDPNPRHICITGGEPLEQTQSEMFNLLQILQGWHGIKNLRSIVIETNGAQDVQWLMNKPFRSVTQLSVDYKLPCTGRTKSMLPGNFVNLNRTDLIKFICEDVKDTEVAKEFLTNLRNSPCQAVMMFHTLGGTAQDWLPRVIMSWTELQQRFDLRIGLQLHKLINMK